MRIPTFSRQSDTAAETAERPTDATVGRRPARRPYARGADAATA